MPAPDAAVQPARELPLEPRDGELLVWTDGACSGNPGPGGWAAIVARPTASSRSCPAARRTRPTTAWSTRRRSRGCARCPPAARVCVVTDSRLMLDSMTKWIAGWKRKGWKTAGGEPVKNQDLVRALDAELARHEVRWHWVRGHETGAAHAHKALNDRADRLAVAAAAAARFSLRGRRLSRRGAAPQCEARALRVGDDREELVARQNVGAVGWFMETPAAGLGTCAEAPESAVCAVRLPAAMVRSAAMPALGAPLLAAANSGVSQFRRNRGTIRQARGVERVVPGPEWRASVLQVGLAAADAGDRLSSLVSGPGCLPPIGAATSSPGAVLLVHRCTRRSWVTAGAARVDSDVVRAPRRRVLDDLAPPFRRQVSIRPCFDSVAPDGELRALRPRDSPSSRSSQASEL